MRKVSRASRGAGLIQRSVPSDGSAADSLKISGQGCALRAGLLPGSAPHVCHDRARGKTDRAAAALARFRLWGIIHQAARPSLPVHTFPLGVRPMPNPNDQIGPYVLVRQLGRGAFGVVWLAERRGALVTTQVALKLLLE